MRVVEVTRFGGPEVLALREVADPVAGPGEVVIDVAVADTLWVETMIRRGSGRPFFGQEPPYRAGVGVSGTVRAVGEGVDAGWIGRRVVTRTGEYGGYVERALEPVEALVPVPDGVSFADAAALLHDGVTAVALAGIVRVRAGDRVLVTAAGGGLGALLVQLAHAAGGYVVPAGRGAAKLERVRRLGADAVVDYSEPGWIERVRAVAPALDVVLDGAGGAYGREAFDLVARGGRFSAHGTPAGAFAQPDPAQAAARGIIVTGIQEVQLEPERFRAYAAQALAEGAAGRLRPLIGQTFPVERAADAHTAIEQRAVIGKTLLTVA
jgi:NADPH2:quinone reductase